MIPDAELVKQVIEGEKRAFNELFRRYEKHLFAFLYSKVKNRELAFDILQETFIDAFTGISNLREAERFPSWLFTIARRKAWSAMRQGNDWNELPESITANNSVTDEILRKELSEIVRKAVRTLPEKLREVSYPEVCDRLGIPVSTLKSRLYLARNRLREKLAPFVMDLEECGHFLTFISSIISLHYTILPVGACGLNTTKKLWNCLKRLWQVEMTLKHISFLQVVY